MSIVLEFTGFEEAQRFLAQENLDEQLAEAVVFIGEGLRSGAATRTPVDTGAMQRAWEFLAAGLRGLMGIAAGATNPRSGVLVSEYAPLVDKRVGILGAVVSSDWPRLGAAALDSISLEG